VKHFADVLGQEQQQFGSLPAQSDSKVPVNPKTQTEPPRSVPREDHDYEAGFGGQEDLEDRYATTSGEH
jgi:ATPase inhibitor, mitochondrial